MKKIKIKSENGKIFLTNGETRIEGFKTFQEAKKFWSLLNKQNKMKKQ